MPLFAERLGRAPDATLTPTEETGLGGRYAASDDAPAVTPPGPGRVRRTLRAINASRATWFVAGALAGVVGALALAWYVATSQLRAPQTFIVSPDGTASYSRIADALAASRPGDIVRVEPGVYREHVELRSGADLVARVPGTVTIARPGGSNAPALLLTGPFNARVTGIRIESDTPVDAGVRITAPAATLELIEITGLMSRGIDLSPASAVTVRGSRFAITGLVLAVPDDAYATLVNSVAVRSGGTGGTALSIATSARVVLRGNVFSGYNGELIEGVGAARRADLLAGNVVVPAPAPPATARPAPRARGSQGGR
jgi:hypothetical protein